MTKTKMNICNVEISTYTNNVVHSTNGCVIAYCDTREQANIFIYEFNKLKNKFRGKNDSD